VLKVYQVNSQEGEVSHNWTFLSTKSFLARVVLRALSQILFQKMRLIFFFFEKGMYCMQKKKKEIYIFEFCNICVMNESGQLSCRKSPLVSARTHKG